jgi:hypothetical protein
MGFNHRHSRDILEPTESCRFFTPRANSGGPILACKVVLFSFLARGRTKSLPALPYWLSSQDDKWLDSDSIDLPVVLFDIMTYIASDASPDSLLVESSYQGEATSKRMALGLAAAILSLNIDHSWLDAVYSAIANLNWLPVSLLPEDYPPDGYMSDEGVAPPFLVRDGNTWVPGAAAPEPTPAAQAAMTPRHLEQDDPADEPEM